VSGRTGPGAQPPGGTAPHALVDEVDEPALCDDSRHHLGRVRRLRDGDPVTVTDGAGRWRLCRLVSGELEPDGEVVVTARPSPPITVAFALTKGDKPELVVQKLTELGVDHILAFRAARSVVRWDDDRAAAHLERWRSISRAAVEQSRRCWLPEIHPIGDVADLVRLGAARVDRGGSPPSLSRSVVAVGPEGGWSEEERERLPSEVALGPHVLRAETAALTAGGVLCSIRSGLVREVPIAPTEQGKPG
jgi:16S rRNA (uracil1498-N3)-methyltransferase